MRQARFSGQYVPDVPRSCPEQTHGRKDKMNTEELKQEIAQRTGMAEDLLTGDTSEEVLARARSLLKYRQDNKATAPRTTGEAFAEWMKNQLEIDDGEQAAIDVLADLDEAVRIAAGGYPAVADHGEIDSAKLPDARTAREKFAEYMAGQLSFNPVGVHNSWPGKTVRL